MSEKKYLKVDTYLKARFGNKICKVECGNDNPNQKEHLRLDDILIEFIEIQDALAKDKLIQVPYYNGKYLLINTETENIIATFPKRLDLEIK